MQVLVLQQRQIVLQMLQAHFKVRSRQLQMDKLHSLRVTSLHMVEHKIDLRQQLLQHFLRNHVSNSLLTSPIW
jgi:hypothetical protein